MRRCALPAPLDREFIALSDHVKRYLSASLRLRDGDQFIGFDGQGRERVFELKRDESADILIAVGVGESYDGRAGAPVGLCFALPKGDKLDLVARQITELGISALYLWSAERSIGIWKTAKVESKLSRLTRVIREASRQSGRADQLKVVPPTSLRELITSLSDIPLKIFLDPTADGGWPSYDAGECGLESPKVREGGTLEISVNVSEAKKNEEDQLDCVLVVGPEGGLSEAEVSLLKESGWQGVRLRSPVLRTETAGVVSCAIALDRLGYLA